MVIWLCHSCILLKLGLDVLKGGRGIYSQCHLPNPVSHTWQELNKFRVGLSCARYPENVFFELLFQLEEAPSFWSVVYVCRVVAPGLRTGQNPYAHTGIKVVVTGLVLSAAAQWGRAQWKTPVPPLTGGAPLKCCPGVRCVHCCFLCFCGHSFEVSSQVQCSQPWFVLECIIQSGMLCLLLVFLFFFLLVFLLPFSLVFSAWL